MLNIFSKLSSPLRKFKIKPGRIKELNEYKIKLVEETKTLKKEKRNLVKKIKELNEEKQNLNPEDIENLKNEKQQLELDVSKLLRVKNVQINISKLEEKKIDLETKVDFLNSTYEQTEKKLALLKEERATLLDEIENLNIQKEISNNSHQVSKFTIEYVDSLKDGLAFEQYFSNLLDKLGFYDIKITNGSGDYGIDVLAYNDDILYGFQCKLYSSPVGNSAIQEAYSGKSHYDCHVAVVVTNNYFTDQARKQAKETNVLLWDRTILMNKLKYASNIDFTIKI